MKLLSIEYIPGVEFEALGIVKGTVVQTKNVGKDFMAGMKTLVGGEITGYTEMLNEARQIATKRMVDEAKEMNADAVTRYQERLIKILLRMRFSDTHLSAKAIIPMNVPSISPKRLILLNRLRSLTVFQTIWMFMFRIIRTKKPVICTYLQKNSQVLKNL